MRNTRRYALTAALVGAAFAGGAFVSHLGHAQQSPYDPLGQMARVLVFMENHYVDPVEREDILNGAIKGMVAELDPHSAYMPPKDYTLFAEETEGTFGGIGVEVDFKNDTVTVIAPIEGTPAFEGGIRSGDVLLAVDGKPLRGLSIDKIVRLMRGAPDTTVKISLKRAGASEPIHLDLVRRAIHVTSVEGKRLSHDIGYLRLKQFQSGTHRELLLATGKVRGAAPTPLAGVILDMRNNPGGLIDEAEAVADELLTDGLIYSTRHRNREIDRVEAEPGGALTGLPVVVLVNEYSASSAELVAGALQDNDRATILGGRTFGKGSVQTIFQLPGGAGLRLTTMRYYTPAGRAIQIAGIEPDVLVRYDVVEGEPDAMREGSLDGHLAAESPSPTGAARPVVKGGKRPEHTPTAELPIDPVQSDDVALRTAHELLRKKIAGK